MVGSCGGCDWIVHGGGWRVRRGRVMDLEIVVLKGGWFGWGNSRYVFQEREKSSGKGRKMEL